MISVISVPGRYAVIGVGVLVPFVFRLIVTPRFAALVVDDSSARNFWSAVAFPCLSRAEEGHSAMKKDYYIYRWLRLLILNRVHEM